MDRRQFLTCAAGAMAAGAVPWRGGGSAAEPFRLRYVLASPMYGTTPLAELLPEVAATGSEALDIWPRPHANHREQVEEIGHEAFCRLLEERQVQLGIITRFDLGPYGLRDELPVVRRFGGRLIVTGAGRGAGESVKQQVRAFVERMKPHVDAAAELGLTIAIENHANSLIDSADSLRYFAEFAPAEHLGIALAPYHLPQDAALLATVIEALGSKLALFYAWQHGMGCMQAQPKEQELLQLPGRGPLDFDPLLAALKKIRYAGWTEIFMHPYPRGIPILESTGQVTAAILAAREYLESRLQAV